MIRHTYRADGNGRTKTRNLTPVLAIKEFCKECNGWQVREVALCETTICPLWPFRKGRAYTPGRSHKNISKKGAPVAVLASKINERQTEQQTIQGEN